MIFDYINLENSRYQYSLNNTHSPVLVFMNGFRMSMTSWENVISEIGKSESMFTYNRLGVESSSKIKNKQTGNDIVASLRKLLSSLNCHGPYILIGHSLGGLYANLYARLYPEEVLAVVLVDSTHPADEFQLPCVVHKINQAIMSVEKIFDPHKYTETECLSETVNQIRAAGDFPSIPLAIVSGTMKTPFAPVASFEKHLDLQKELLLLSRYSKNFIAEKSGHFPQLTEPKIVRDAIAYAKSGVPNS